ncbi:hypothetical protein ACJ2A9_04760 [Anaerobacillus sp. MEB173]|uniref:hypothetical protein n=1 Tax=Anaerobacillus sp. MEB173 TaxID=3383345 RepID=UPI003F930534
MTKRKMISFDTDEEHLLNHALSQENFSEYIKQLIKFDMEKKSFKEQVRKPNIYEVYIAKLKKTT